MTRLYEIPFASLPPLAPGLAPHLVGARRLPTATSARAIFDRTLPTSGPLWSDPDFLASLRARHRSVGADQTSHASIDALAEGARCVITGQQPGLLLGPLYTLSKALGAIGLAARLSRQHGETVVPVFWCGSDDSDFDEVRSAWWWTRDGATRARLEAAGVGPGSRVGDHPGAAVARAERTLLSEVGAAASVLSLAESIPPDVDLGARAAAWLLRLLRGRGLVVVDARDTTLLGAARPIFDDYAARAGEIAERVIARGEELEGESPLDQVAAQSGLFALRGGRRHKVSPGQIAEAVQGEAMLSPSVLLRAIVQDALLAPVATVLGPSELRYHAQIAPAYEVLGVRAAAPLLRPHLFALPAGSAVPESDADWTEVMADPARAARWWSRGRSDRDTLRAFDDAERAQRSLVETFRKQVDDPRLENELSRMQARWPRLREKHLRRAISPGLRDWGGARGVSQERFYAAPLALAWCGEGFDVVLDAVAHRFGDACARDEHPFWAYSTEVES